jgi:homoserine O-acetyltransferase
LFIPAQSDLLLVPDYAKRAVDILKKQGKTAEIIVIVGDGGHLDGVFNVAKVGEDIRKFLQ